MTCLGGGPGGALTIRGVGAPAGMSVGSGGGAFLGIGVGRAFASAFGLVRFVLTIVFGVPSETAEGGSGAVPGCGTTSA